METDTNTGFRLSLQQERVWDWQREGGDSQLRCAIELTGTLDAARLRRALSELVARHEILRTQFVKPVGLSRPLQAPRERLEPEWIESDLRNTPPLEQSAALDAEWLSLADADPEHVVRCNLVTLSDVRHVLQIGLPILCCDAESVRNVITELAQRYGGTFSPAEDPVQYADYAEWQHAVLESDDPQAQEGRAYWEEYGSGLTPTRLPWEDTSTPPLNSEMHSLDLVLDQDLCEQIEARAQADAVTPEELALATWAATIARLSARSDVAIGYQVAGRNHQELSDAVGLFQRFVPVCATVKLEAPFSSTLAGVRAALHGATRHQDYLPPAQADAAATTIGFIWQTASAPYTSNGLCFANTRLACRTNAATLQLVCTGQANIWRAELHYAPHAFERTDVERIAGYWLRLLRSVVAQLATAVGEIELLDNLELEHLLNELSHTSASDIDVRCIHELVELQAERNPHRIAVSSVAQQLTFAELNTRANQVAGWLRERGVTANVPVGLYLERSVDLIVGLLGILKAGGAYVPLDTRHPPARCAEQLIAASARAVVTRTSWLEQLPAADWAVLDLVGDSSALDAQSSTNLPRINSPSDLAYVIYTSGSTGVPKGVGITHRNLVNYATSICVLLGLDTNNEPLCFGHVSTIAADLGNTSLYPALISGHCVQILSAEGATDVQKWLEETREAPLDVLKITPSHLNALLGSPRGDAILPCHTLILGGEASRWELVERVRQRSRCTIINHYGPTETTVGVLAYVVPAEPLRTQTVPIGRPLPNTSVYVLDGHRHPVPGGVAGELYIGGAGVARGYLNQPEETAERFITVTLGPTRTERLYRTGDLVRYLADGTVEFLGRMDDQVKVRGYRVEPGEVASVLAQYPGVLHALVLPHASDDNDVRLYAYLAGPGLQKVAEETLKLWAAERLPEYMLPSRIIVVDALPLNANGKIDRQAVAKLGEDSALRRGRGPRDLPTTPTERAIAEIWSHVLGVDDVGLHENFFALGGHSLLAIQVVNRVRSTLGIQVSLQVLFESPTVAGIAAAINGPSEAQTLVGV